jgi:hypothetical protein
MTVTHILRISLHTCDKIRVRGYIYILSRWRHGFHSICDPVLQVCSDIRSAGCVAVVRVVAAVRAFVAVTAFSTAAALAVAAVLAIVVVRIHAAPIRAITALKNSDIGIAVGHHHVGRIDTRHTRQLLSNPIAHLHPGIVMVACIVAIVPIVPIPISALTSVVIRSNAIRTVRIRPYVVVPTASAAGKNKSCDEQQGACYQAFPHEMNPLICLIR